MLIFHIFHNAKDTFHAFVLSTSHLGVTFITFIITLIITRRAIRSRWPMQTVDILVGISAYTPVYMQMGYGIYPTLPGIDLAASQCTPTRPQWRNSKFTEIPKLFFSAFENKQCPLYYIPPLLLDVKWQMSNDVIYTRFLIFKFQIYNQGTIPNHWFLVFFVVFIMSYFLLFYFIIIFLNSYFLIFIMGNDPYFLLFCL